MLAKYLVMLVLCFLNSSVYAQSVKTYIPERAHQYLPLLKAETLRLMPELLTPQYFGALIEHESCISLKHSRCWSPTSEFKTKREQGVGVGMLTRAYRADGTLRFDALRDLRANYLSELRELSWVNIKTRPDLQIRAVILLYKDSYRRLGMVNQQSERLKMADAAYNGGIGGLQRERRACSLSARCDPDIWDLNVERYCLKSKKALYAGRSACDINRHHVHDTYYTRMPKYQPYFEQKM